MKKIILFLLLIAIFSPLPAVSAVPVQGYFTAENACMASSKIRNNNQAKTQLTAGTVYKALELNKKNGDYLRIIVPEAHQKKLWIKKQCGTWSSEPNATKPPPPSFIPSKFKPFFDNKHNPVTVDFPKYQKRDITPPPPKLNAFDKNILELCGDFGAKVKSSDFKKLLSKKTSAPVIKRIREEVGCESFGVCNKESIIETLTTIWFKRRGFAHIFCGEPKANKIGGLHYVGRYLEMQQKAWGGPLSVKKGIEEIIPNTIYSLGVQHQWKGRTVETKIKGYAYSLNAADLLIHTTRAYVQLSPGRSKSKKTCLYTVPPKENTPEFQALLVVQNSSIVTFYPDATPGRTPQCN